MLAYTLKTPRTLASASERATKRDIRLFVGVMSMLGGCAFSVLVQGDLLFGSLDLVCIGTGIVILTFLRRRGVKILD